MKFGIKTTQLPAPKVLDDSKSTEAKVNVEARAAAAQEAAVDSYLALPKPAYEPPSDHIEGNAKLDRLVADDFPFDDSQIAFIEGISNQQYACGTGSAGTGKTTCTKAIVDRIKNGVGQVDMTTYWKSPESNAGDPDDDYEMPENKIPSICLVGFTGRSSQMIKKNFPREWHGNIMTIHRMLGFMPEFYEEYDDDAGEVRNKMRFVPSYTANNKLPWDVIIIDEAGMVSVDLWHLIHDAIRETTRIIMIGDINQLPPVHGRSIFGFAMAEWPSYELTHIHRQVGVNNSIVDAAHNILKGYRPTPDGPRDLNFDSNEEMLRALKFLAGDPTWKFAMVKIPEEARKASIRVRKAMQLLHNKIYDPDRDTIITAINGLEESRGRELGQLPMNQELALVLNKNPERYIIDAGRERRQFAVGDKVMATRNDHTIGITNGMTGIITEITRNEAYAGELRRFGLISEVSAYLAESDEDDDYRENFSLEDLTRVAAAQDQGQKDKREKAERGPASHNVTVQFGTGTHAINVTFSTLSEVLSLMTAYAVTCHKMQGGESPLCAVISHQSHNSMLYREWLYTAVTRSSERCILFYTDLGLKAALNKQKIQGVTMAAKIREFKKLSADSIIGKGLQVRLPLRRSTRTEVSTHESKPITEYEQPAIRAEEIKAAPKAKPTEFVIKVRVVHEPAPTPAPKPSVDGGDLTPQQEAVLKNLIEHQPPLPTAKAIAMTHGFELKRLPAPPTLLRLTHQPKPKPASAPVKPMFKFGVKA